MPDASLLERVLFLPDHWLRRMDFGIAMVSTLMMLAHMGDTMLWGLTALTGFTLWATNGTARGLRKLRSVMPDILLWMILRFGW